MAVNQDQRKPQDPAALGNPDKKYKFNEGMIDFDRLKMFGLSKEHLQAQGVWDQLLMGQKTSKLIAINAYDVPLQLNNVKVRLHFKQEDDGKLLLVGKGPTPTIDFTRNFHGHTFTAEDEQNLMKDGNMGRTVPLFLRGRGVEECVISRDKLTNDLTYCPVKDLRIPEKISGVELTETEKSKLLKGEKIWVEGMNSSKNNTFDAYLQANAERRGVEYIFKNPPLIEREQIYGAKLTPEQQKMLSEGKTFFLENMQWKTGETFSRFITGDPRNQSFSVTRYNPETGEIHVPREWHGVKTTAEEHKKLMNGEYIYLDNMQRSNGQPFDSYIKVDLTTGEPMYASTPDKFEEKPFDPPKQLYGVELTASQRADAQEGKVIELKGMIGYDDKPFDGFFKKNPVYPRMDYYDYNPDLKKGQTQNQNSSQTVTDSATAPKKSTKESAQKNADDKPAKSTKTTKSKSTKQTAADKKEKKQVKIKV